jgi:hypothetical protein
VSEVMISYVLYVWNPSTKKFYYAGQVKYQAKIIEGERLRLWMKKFKVIKVEHDLDANVIDLYLEEVT